MALVNFSHRIIQKLAFQISAHTVREALQTVFLIYLARKSSNTYGEFMLAMSVGQIILFIAEFGINQHLVNLLAQEKSDTVEILAQVSILKAGFFIIAFMGGWGFMLWQGYSKYVDETWVDSNCYPYNFQTALDRAYFDHQLLTYDRFEKTASLNPTTKQIELYKSRYKVLVLPPVQHIPYATLAKAKQFYDAGGIVIGWQRAPSRSAKFGNSDGEVQDLSVALWNSLTPVASLTPIKKNANGGKTFFIAATDEQTILEHLRRILHNAGIESDFKVVKGTWKAPNESVAEKWTGYNHRKRNGLDVFMVWNGAATAATITVRLQAAGDPELWNPTTLAITPLNHVRVLPNQVEVELNIPAEESCLIVFKPAVVKEK